MTKLIRNKKFTRITALLLAVAVIFGTMFALPVSAASGDKVTITFDFCYDSTGNIIKFQQTTVSDGYTVGTPGEELCKIFADGKEAYCIEPTVLPPSRIAKRRPTSIAIGVISSTSISTLSPGIHISVPSGSEIVPVTSVVLK